MEEDAQKKGKRECKRATSLGSRETFRAMDFSKLLWGTKIVEKREDAEL